MKIFKKIVCGCLLLGMLLNGVSHAYSISYAAEEVNMEAGTEAPIIEVIDIEQDTSISEDNQSQEEVLATEEDTSSSEDLEQEDVDSDGNQAGDVENTEDTDESEELDEEIQSEDQNLVLPEEDLLLESNDLLVPNVVIGAVQEANSENVFGTPFKRPTRDTYVDHLAFPSDGNDSYNDIKNMINNFNVISQRNVSASHIYGPVLAGGAAYKYAITMDHWIDSDDLTPQNQYLTISDYSRGTSSFVNKLTCYDEVWQKSPTFKVDYGTDTITTPIPFYTSDDWDLIKEGSEWYFVEKIYIDSTTSFASPNAGGISGSGDARIYNNSNYVNFDSLYAAILAESRQLVTDGTIDEKRTVEVVSPDADGKLTVYAGHSYEIKDASKLKKVDIVYPAGYDFFENPYTIPTTINITDDSINPITIDGKSTSQFPSVTMNGQIIDQTAHGDGGIGEGSEYSEEGNKLIWNMPNIVTSADGDNRVVTLDNGANLIGHLIMPQAEFWNCSAGSDGTIQWEGGNINGCVIAKAFHGGNVEAHIWPYSGTKEKPVEPTESTAEYIVEALKTVDGEIPTDKYSFLLDLYNPDKMENGDAIIPEGILNTAFPLQVDSQLEAGKEGKIEFPNLKFNKEGTYSFIIKENIPDVPVAGMDYDQTQYKIVITVVKETVDEVEQLVISQVVKTKFVDEDGTVMDPEESISDNTGFVFDNKTETETESLSIKLTKTNQMNQLLSGAEFKVQEVTVDSENSQPVVVGNGYDQVYTSTEDGTFEITQLEANKKYMVTETKVPVGHEDFTGYWLIRVLEDLTYTMTEYDVNHQEVKVITDNKIQNKKYEVVLPNTGGIGTYIFYIIGFACIAVGLIYCIGKLIPRKEKKETITKKKKHKARAKR